MTEQEKIEAIVKQVIAGMKGSAPAAPAAPAPAPAQAPAQAKTEAPRPAYRRQMPVPLSNMSSSKDKKD